jgi:phosphoglycerate dehydrogenase-like enzyme
MDILVTMPAGEQRSSFFPPELQRALEALGDVDWNGSEEQFTPEELGERIDGVDVCVTGWGVPQFTEAVLASADDLELVAHTGGSVARVASDALYDRGIEISSANHVMARHVAELVVGEVVCSLRNVFDLDRSMHDGEWSRFIETTDTLYDASVGLVGLGTIGEYLLDHLAPFHPDVRVYDPYLDEKRVAEYDFVELTDLESTLRGADIVSLHASRTPETIGMIGAEELAQLPDGCLFVNTARAELTEEDALVDELRSGRLSACLDVYHEEPLPADHELRSLDNVVLTPHVGGSTIRPPCAAAMIEEIERFAGGEPLAHSISRDQFELMTR